MRRRWASPREAAAASGGDEGARESETRSSPRPRSQRVSAAAVEAPPAQQLDWEALGAELDAKSPLEIMDHVSPPACPTAAAALFVFLAGWLGWVPPTDSTPTPPPWQALATFGADVGIAFSGAEDVALIEYAHLTGRPYRVFRRAARVWVCAYCGVGGVGVGGGGGADRVCPSHARAPRAYPARSHPLASPHTHTQPGHGAPQPRDVPPV